MQPNDLLVIHAAPHPSSKVQQRGFGLDHTYVDLCWTSVVGPSAAALLRRMPLLWQDEEPARISAGELASGLGIGARPGIARTIRRLAQFGLAQRPSDLEVAVFTHVAPLSRRFLERAPGWVYRTHTRLLAEHLRELEALGPTSGAGGPVESGPRLGRGYRQTVVRNPPAVRPPLGR